MPLSLDAIPAILERFEAGEKLGDIAKDYEVSKQAVSKYLYTHAPEDYLKAKSVVVERELESIDDDLVAAQGRLQVDIARERARLRLWWLERKGGFHPRQALIGDKDADPVQVQVVDYNKADE